MEENNNKNKKMKAAKPKRGLWKPEEDLILKNYIETHGEGNWATVSKRTGLMRGGKSCRLRWKNYLRPNIKRGGMSKEEEDLIIRMHKLLGNRWSLIAGRLPGRTDNEVKNYWNTHLNKKRKIMDSNNQQHIGNQHNDDDDNNNNNNNNNIEKQNDKKKARQSDDSQPILSNKKKARQSDDSQPILSTLTNEGLMHSDMKQVMKEEEEGTSFTDTTWMERTVQCFNYDYDTVGLTPLMMNSNYYSSLVFDEQPFTPCLDSFVLFEAFGTDSDVGIQSFLP